MTRHRTWDIDVLLDKVAGAFRSKGYNGTSLDDIVEATGVLRPSLYGAFNSKHALYLSALKRYGATQAAHTIAELEAQPTGRRSLERFFELILNDCGDSRGCLLANATMERGLQDVEATVCIADNRHRIEESLRAAVLRGRQDGSLRPGDGAATVARWLFSASHGLRALAKSGCPRAQLKEIADLTLKMI